MEKRKKSRTYQPKDINDLIGIYYDPTRLSDRQSYEAGFVNPIISEATERQSQKYFTKTIRKLDRELVKTPDYRTDDSTVFFEVTRIQPHIPDIGERPIPWRPLRRINEAIRHADEKDIAFARKMFDSENALYLLLVYVSVLILSLPKTWLQLESLIHDSIFASSRLDAIVFVPQSASINGMDSEMSFPPQGFVKSSLVSQRLLEATRFANLTVMTSDDHKP